MILEQQVCNLYLSIRLHEPGVRAPALFYWYSQNEKDWELHISKNGQRYSEYNISHWNYNAYTVGELGEILKNIWFSTVFVPGKSLWRGDFFDCEERTRDYKPAVWGETEADCRAKALIYCIENSIVKIEDINQ